GSGRCAAPPGAPSARHHRHSGDPQAGQTSTPPGRSPGSGSPAIALAVTAFRVSSPVRQEGTAAPPTQRRPPPPRPAPRAGRPRGGRAPAVRQPSALYKPHRFPGELISHAVWLSYRFLLSYRDVEEVLAQRGVTVSYETIRRWCRKFGQLFADGLRRRRARP